MTIRELGSALNTGSALAWTAHQSGDHVLATAQLINVARGFRLWRVSSVPSSRPPRGRRIADGV